MSVKVLIVSSRLAGFVMYTTWVHYKRRENHSHGV